MEIKSTSHDDYSDLSEERLIALVQGQDLVAFNLLYERYWCILFNEAHKRLDSLTLCEEIVQDVFVDFWETCSHRQIKDLGAYLFASMRFAVFRNYKKVSRQQQAEQSLAKVAINLTDNADTGVRESDLLKFINDWIIQLPEKRREIFRLRLIEGMSTKEISEYLHISQNTVQNHLSISMSHLRLLVKKYFILFFVILFT